MYWLGTLFFVGMMATGYYYNLTFIQFGLLDLGLRFARLNEAQVAQQMTLLALVTSMVAFGVGWWMARQGWSNNFRLKLRLAFAVVAVQTVLTALAPAIRSQAGFTAWILAASIALGVGVPATFSMAVDLVPVRWRGLAAALITAGAYFPAILNPSWAVENFSRMILPIMAAGALFLGCLAFLSLKIVDRLAAQHLQPEFGRGRFVRLEGPGSRRLPGSVIVLIVLMFGTYFVDSLGFLRLAETPFFFQFTWQAASQGPRLAIGSAHVLAAIVGGILYTALDEKELFLWVFGIFALVHLMYTFAAAGARGGSVLAMPVLYAVAVSLYTVINFAIWADISTPQTISRNTAAGVALSGWTATFLSTALSLRLAHLPLDLHLRIVDSLAMLFFLVVLLLIFFQPERGAFKSHPGIKSE